MNRFIICATAVWFYAGTAVAQAPADKPADAQGTEMRFVTGNEQKHAREADARHCLDLKDERAIIRCAERYRYPYRGGAR